MAKRRRPAVKEEDDDEPEVEATPRPRRRWRRRFVVLCVLLIAMVGVAPFLIANSPLRTLLLNWQMPPGWSVDCQQANVSWIGQQSFTNVAILDAAGQPLATVDALSVERSLLGLGVQPTNLGAVRVEKPVLYLASRKDGTNVEDFLAALEKRFPKAATPETATSKSSVAGTIEVVEGSVRGVDTESGQQWSIDNINSFVALGEQPAADGSAIVTDRPGEAAGRIKYRIQPNAEGQQQFDLLAEGVMLASFKPWLARVIGDCQLAGTAGLDAHAAWATVDGKPFFKTWGRAETASLSIKGAALKGDELRSEKVVIPWNVARNGEMITVEEFKVDGDWCDLEAVGTLKLPDFNSISLADLRQPEFSFQGEVSLPKLAAMLPNTLQIREGVRIDTGDLGFEGSAKNDGNEFKWSTLIALEKLMGSRNGKPISWDEPVSLSSAWKDSASGPRLDRVVLASPFANADLATTAEQVAGKFDCDLDAVTREVSQFIDLAGLTAQGKATGNLTLKSSAGDAFAANADVTLTGLMVAKAGKPIWEEPQLTTNIEAVGSAAELMPKSISTGKLELKGAQDSLIVSLLTPVDLSNKANWSMQVEGGGPLASWAGRLRPWVAGVPVEISGDAALKTKVTLADGTVQVGELTGSVNQLRVRDGSVAIDEPHIEFSGDCQWSAAARKWASKQLELRSSIVAFRSQDLRFEFPVGQVPVMTGDMAFNAHLERLSGAAGLVRDGGSWPRGAAKGVMRFATNSEQVLTDFNFDTEQLALVKATAGGPPRVIWSEPKLSSAGKAIYTIASDRAAIDNLTINGQTMQLAGAAVWDKPMSEGTIRVNGALQYDPTALATLIAGYAGPAVIIEGDRVVRFDARGAFPQKNSLSHWSRAWQAKAEAGWNKAAVFGLPISAGKLQGELANGKLQTAPLDVSVGEGKLTTNPTVIFDPLPQRLIIPAGPLISNVQISPAVSEQMLKYVAPILAGATRVDGKFSIDLAETQIPLGDAKKLSTEGRLSVHQLTVLPGPLIADVVRLVQQIQSLKDPQNLLGAATTPKQAKLMAMNDQQIDFKVIESRVYHRNLQFVIDDVPITSQGSVGFDQTLALELSIPIQDRWIDGEDALRGLAGQSLKIPIQGTFQNPKIDERAIADITKQIIRNTARDAIGGEINRQLEKLFQGK
jgi:translocation and assembly module TamB